MQKKIEISVLGLTYSQSKDNSYTLILNEVEGVRRIPIVIGHFEAQSIALQMEKMKPSRPLTHDLFKNLADSFNIVVEEVIIEKYEDGIFYSCLCCNDGNKLIRIDSRTSDAVSIALRFDCPIYIYDDILEKTGMVFDDKEYNAELTKKDELTSIDNDINILRKLEEELQKSINDEDYEKASFIRDEILKIKSK